MMVSATASSLVASLVVVAAAAAAAAAAAVAPASSSSLAPEDGSPSPPSQLPQPQPQPQPQFAGPGWRLSPATACGNHEVPAGTQVSGGDGEHGAAGTLRLAFPNGTVQLLPRCWDAAQFSALEAMWARAEKREKMMMRRRTAAADASASMEEPRQRPVGGNGPPNQWLVWAEAEGPVWANGFSYLSMNFNVPPVPETLGANLCFFPGLQPTYDPKPYDFILQPVLAIGSWISSQSRTVWALNSVTCIPAAGRCVYGKAFKTEPGRLVFGEIKPQQGTGLQAGKTCWNVTTQDTATFEQNSIQYCSQYMATWAFAAFEHNPVSPVSDCSTLPTGSITFGNITAKPSIGTWQGTRGGDAPSCVDIPTFPGSEVTITF